MFTAHLTTAPGEQDELAVSSTAALAMVTCKLYFFSNSLRALYHFCLVYQTRSNDINMCNFHRVIEHNSHPLYHTR